MFKLPLFLSVFMLAIGVYGADEAAPGAQAFTLRKLIIADTEAKVAAVPTDAGGSAPIFVKDVPTLDDPEFATVVKPYIGGPMNLERANALAGLIKQFGLKRDRIVNVVVPGLTREDIAANSLRLSREDFVAGVFRLIVAVNRYNTLDFKGNHWFSQKLLTEKLGVKPGDEISIARLDEAVNWANTNPFRRVQVALVPLQDKPEATNLIIGVQERIPVRLVASYDDTGTPLLGRRHYTGSILYGNFLGLDHQVSYQFSTTDHQRLFRAHSFSYDAPLPWRHRIGLSVNYLEVHPSLYGGVLTQTGKNISGNLRYTMPLRAGNNPVEAFAAVDFKQNNNNLAYGGNSFGGVTDIFELTAGVSAVHRDSRGVWLLGANLFISPGHLNSLNTDAAFRGETSTTGTGRAESQARYAYGNFSVQRVQNLPQGWQFISRATVQLATNNLLGSEQISIGGSNTVRGFDEHIVGGDAGLVFSNDLQTPVLQTTLKHLPFRSPLETRFVAFYDVGSVYNIDPTIHDQVYDPNFVAFALVHPGALPPNPPTLASTGFGVRMNLGNALNISADYGWQITRLAPGLSKGRNRGHVKVVLAY